MSFSVEPKDRKNVKKYGFFHLQKRFGNKYGKQLMDAATKMGIDDAKTESKKVAQKTAEATGDLTGNKIVEKITTAGKTNKSTKDLQENERQETYIPPEKK